ncbi:MAG: hypothetical protein AB1297_07835, partial [bacterium]
AVNAGYEAIVPEREIIYYGWQGTGYIIQDPTTGAGACLISGGAAGAQMLIAMGIYVDAESLFVNNDALVVEGDLSGDPSAIFLTKKLLGYEQTMMAVGATFYLNYNPIYRRIITKIDYLSEISKREYDILYHIGHGNSGVLLLDGTIGEVVTSAEIAGSSTDFLFVYIDACKSAEGICQAFNSKSALGYVGLVACYYSWWFETEFWLECIHNETIGEAKKEAEKLAEKITKIKANPTLFGDESIILKRLVITTP